MDERINSIKEKIKTIAKQLPNNVYESGLFDGMITILEDEVKYLESKAKADEGKNVSYIEVRRPKRYVVTEDGILDTSDEVKYMVWKGDLYKRYTSHGDSSLGIIIANWEKIGSVIAEYEEIRIVIEE